MEKVVIVMPAYNEAENIGRMIDALLKVYFPQIKEAEMHLLVVDDNSPDGTGDVVRREMAKYKNLHLLQGKKQGLGWAYIRGFRYAMNELHADAVIEMDADFQHNPIYVRPLVKAFVNGADYVIGSRYVKGGSIPKEWALHRKAVSFLGNLFARVILLLPQLHDVTTGFRLTRVKGVLDQIDLENIMALDRFAYKVDLLFKSHKLSKKTREVPIAFAPRVREKSKFDMKELIETYKVVITLRMIESKRFIKFGIVGFVGYLVNAFGLWFFGRFSWPEPAIWASAVELAIINNFLFNNFWTFSNEQIQGVKNWGVKFFQFNLTSMGALMIQTIVGSLGTIFLEPSLGPNTRQILLPFIIVFLVLPYNYFMYNAIIWRTWRVPFVEKFRAKIKKEL